MRQFKTSVIDAVHIQKIVRLAMQPSYNGWQTVIFLMADWIAPILYKK